MYTNRLQCVECGRVSREHERGWTGRLTVDDEVAGPLPPTATISSSARDRAADDRVEAERDLAAWHAEDSIPLGRDRLLRVIEVRPGAELDDDPVLVVETI